MSTHPAKHPQQHKCKKFWHNLRIAEYAAPDGMRRKVLHYERICRQCNRFFEAEPDTVAEYVETEVEITRQEFVEYMGKFTYTTIVRGLDEGVDHYYWYDKRVGSVYIGAHSGLYYTRYT